MKKISILVLLFLAIGFTLTQAQTQTSTQDAIKAYQDTQKAYQDASLELQRINVRTQKREIIKKAVTFTDEQSKAFWPVYDNYEKQLITLNDSRLAIIKDYAANYQTMTDENASELTDRAMDFQQKRLALMQSYVGDLKKILPGKTVARLVQLENQMGLLVDLQIASEVPLVK